ncbi:hypothetical protein AB205_0136560 [Aquarana catesbeiana]|uniref:Prefoldin subunit 6 n=1 Tax=Aquarana catesbeiana TaxID=8400 RepID=A0A2G9RPK8_AQUCT|nr:hypothetical protein AB205_0136560 [Aquarana catesbeiana]
MVLFHREVDVYRIFMAIFLMNSPKCMYLQELGVLDDSNTVYKLIGPVLVKQDLEEAKSTVEKRLQYINGEIKRYETMLKDLEQKSEQQRASLTKLQQEYQRTQIKGPVKA